MSAESLSKPLHLFEGYGVEIEYMIVDSASLDIRPMCDKVLTAANGELSSEIKQGPLLWSNELVLHVIELKTDGPVQRLEGLEAAFQDGLNSVNELLGAQGACLLPTGAHPWMDPFRETQLWPHDYSAIYESFNRIFDCRGHGWSNLQSIHLNLPFADEDEFIRLHSAIRLVLPLLPALAASSPYMDGRFSGWMDTRMETYRNNCIKIPSITGSVIPESVKDTQDYRVSILERIYEDLLPHDPEKILQEEWVNARGAITRFDRNTIEIRVLDVQECAEMDVSILRFTVALLQWIIMESGMDVDAYQGWSIDSLSQLFRAGIRDSLQAHIDDQGYLAFFGYEGGGACTIGAFMNYLLHNVLSLDATTQRNIEFIVNHGSLAQRLVKAVGLVPEKENMMRVYRQLVECLRDGQKFGNT